MSKVSIILPARNEAKSLQSLLPRLIEKYPDYEIVVIDDGSNDETVRVCKGYDINLIKHPESLGNGAAIKAGARAASGEILIFMDADGQHRAEDISCLLLEVDKGYDLVVGARNRTSHSSAIRFIGNRFYNILATWMTGHRVIDLTSGFRAVRRDKFLDFLNILPNGFSAPTTITMAFFRAGFAVKYIPIQAGKDEGKSHINLIRDGVRFLLIIFRIAVLYSPLKLFFPVSLAIFCTGLGYYIYTYVSNGRFTNMGMLLFISSVIIFLIGLISEQITFLIYLDKKK